MMPACLGRRSCRRMKSWRLYVTTAWSSRVAYSRTIWSGTRLFASLASAWLWPGLALWKVCVAAFILIRMPAAIKQIVTVRSGGVVEVRSPELREGDRAEVTVVVVHPADIQQASNGAGRWRRYAGAFNSGNPSAGDNDRIDADLAREYGNGAGAES